MTAITCTDITRNNTRIARSAGLRMGADGLVMVQVLRPHLACVMILLASFVALTLAKAVLLALIGPSAYDASLIVMQGGGLADRAGAVLLEVDGATRAIAGFIL